ncbi:3-oxoacyl-ACP synthase III family protein [Streptomyces sp. NPDC101227]|uniref:3-oxoacyl-ACP synthase III family protein n=1 Tax=Streptomyces sp. NPDC101227 TaxID=3366136 RepID=UPI003804676C
MIAISGMSYELGSRKVSNSELALSHGLAPDAYVKRSGIEHRRVFGEGEDHLSLTARAVARSLAEAGITAEEIGDETLLILIGTGVPKHFLPPETFILAARIGIRLIRTLNIVGSCSDLVAAIDLAAMALESGRCERVIIAAGMDATIVADPQDPSVSTLFSDGAAAMVLARDGDSELHLDVRACHWESHPQLSVLSGMSVRERRVTPTGVEIHSSFYEMQGVALMQRVVEIAPGLVDRVLARAGWRRDEIDLVLCHQPNARGLAVLTKAIGFAPEIVPATVKEMGNLGPASVLVSMVQAREQGRLKPASKVVILTFGSGMSFAATAATF